MIKKYAEQYQPQVERLIKDYPMNWGESGNQTVIALKNEIVVGIGNTYSNNVHPYREYVDLYVDAVERRKGIGQSLLNELVSLSSSKKFQVMLSSKNKAGASFIKANGFQIARKSFTPILPRSKYTLNIDGNISTFNDLTSEKQKEVVKLQMENYRTFHKKINPLNDEITMEQWEEVVFDDIDSEHSCVWLVENKIEAYIICYEGENPETIEIAYVGGRNILQVENYLPFYLSVIKKLETDFRAIEIEADDVDIFAYTLLNQFEYDDSDSWDTYILR